MVAIKDDATGQAIEVETNGIHLAIREFETPIQFLLDLQAGMFTLTREEYEHLPAVLFDIRRIHTKVNSSNGNQGG
jgi:pentose-5-phosphate-3-epimerase